jgi:hypothetical protein
LSKKAICRGDGIRAAVGDYQHRIQVGTIGDGTQPDCNRALVAEVEYLDGSDARNRW